MPNGRRITEEERDRARAIIRDSLINHNPRQEEPQELPSAADVVEQFQMLRPIETHRTQATANTAAEATTLNTAAGNNTGVARGTAVGTTTGSGIWQQIERDMELLTVPPALAQAITDPDFDLIVDEREPVQTEEKSPEGSAFTYFEERYAKKFFKEKPIFREKIVLKEPDPITEQEEVIVNYNELADTLAQEAVNKICVNPDITPEQREEEYGRQLAFYEELVIKHKRKTNA